jgi:hypothetical protein
MEHCWDTTDGIKQNFFIYILLQARRDAHGIFYVFFITLFALHVSGAICTHHQEHKLQSTAVRTRYCYGIYIYIYIYITKMFGTMKIKGLFYFRAAAPPPPVGQALLIHEVSRSHSTTHHSR